MNSRLTPRPPPPGRRRRRALARGIRLGRRPVDSVAASVPPTVGASFPATTQLVVAAATIPSAGPSKRARRARPGGGQAAPTIHCSTTPSRQHDADRSGAVLLHGISISSNPRRRRARPWHRSRRRAPRRRPAWLEGRLLEALALSQVEELAGGEVLLDGGRSSRPRLAGDRERRELELRVPRSGPRPPSRA